MPGLERILSGLATRDPCSKFEQTCLSIMPQATQRSRFPSPTQEGEVLSAPTLLPLSSFIAALPSFKLVGASTNERVSQSLN